MRIKIILLISILSLYAPLCWAESVVLQWNPNSETDLAGYRLYQATTSGQYTRGNYIAEIPAGTETYTINNLNEGTFFWVVTAFDLSGLESNFSLEVSKVITGTTEPLGKPGRPTLVQ